MTAGRPAAFLDRDGTIIRDQDYPGDPDAVRLIDGAAAAIGRLRASGMVVVVITNQSGIGRGLITEEQFGAVQRRMEELLAVEGVGVDAVYYCPHAPDRIPPCECRKPAPGLYERAVRDLGVDPGRSIFVGDRLRDVLPAAHFGGTGFFIRGTEEIADDRLPAGTIAVDSLAAATELLLARRV